MGAMLKQEIWDFIKMLTGALLVGFGWLVAVDGYGLGVAMMLVGLVLVIKG